MATDTTLFTQLPLYQTQVALLQSWLTDPANATTYANWKTLPRSHLEPLVWAQLRILRTPLAPQPVIWRTTPLIPSTVTSYSVATNKDHTSDPPTVLFAFQPSNFIDYWLTRDVGIIEMLTNQVLPDRIENACLTLSVESDVVRATNQYILPWVERLAYGYFNGLNPAVTLSSETEVSDGSLRYDLAWYATYHGVKKCILLLEFKGPGAIDINQWPATTWTYYGWRSYQMNPSKLTNPDTLAITKKIDTVKTPPAQIYKAGNAIAIAKQVNTYFVSSDAPRILVSDYRSLALFDYNKGSKAAIGLDPKAGVGFSWLDLGDNATYPANRMGMMILAAIIAGVFDTFFASN